MTNIALYDFIGKNRDELIRRCRVKVATRAAPQSTEAEINHGVPLFLEQLAEELRQGRSKTDAINQSAREHGHDLLLQGLTVSQVVHDYWRRVSVRHRPGSGNEGAHQFGGLPTLNRCLDDAIAGAVSEYTHEQDVSRHGASRQLRNLANTAITAFEVLRTGRVGVGGSTGTVLLQSLMAIRAALGSEEPKQEQEAKDLVPTESA